MCSWPPDEIASCILMTSFIYRAVPLSTLEYEILPRVSGRQANIYRRTGYTGNWGNKNSSNFLKAMCKGPELLMLSASRWAWPWLGGIVLAFLKGPSFSRQTFIDCLPYVKRWVWQRVGRKMNSRFAGGKKEGMWKGREITEQSDSANLRECRSKESQVSPEAFGGLLVLNTHASWPSDCTSWRAWHH